MGGLTRRAQKLNVPMSLTIEDIAELYKTKPTVCPCCEQPFDENGGPKYPTVDRLNNSKGYTLDNVIVLCFKCNDVKGRYESNSFTKTTKRFPYVWEWTIAMLSATNQIH